MLGLPDVDTRGAVSPTAAQRKAAAKLDAVDLRWNSFGTPTSILPSDGVLASGYSTDPAQAPAAARDWLAKNAAVFGLTAAQVADLEVVNNAQLAGIPARAVLFRQRLGGLVPALDGMVTVGVADGKITYVSSSITRVSNAPADPALSPLQGWLKAAADVGHLVSPGDAAQIVTAVSGGWTRLGVPGLAVEQQARIRALAMADGTVRPVVEANVVDVAGGAASAYTVLVDAVSGAVLHRHNQIDSFEDNQAFTGAITPVACGPMHAFSLPDSATKSMRAAAAGAPYNDLVVKIFGPGGVLIASGDLATNPEVVTATNAAGFPAGSYAVQVCPFASSTTPILPPFNYVATVTTHNSTTPGATSIEPKWRFFEANPSLSSLDGSTPGNSVVGCWFPTTPGCTYPLGPIQNVAAPGPWDTLPAAGQSSATTIGNNANTHEAWASPLTPGGTAQAPVSPLRDYTAPFTDAWNNSKCDPAQLTPGGNDINAVVTNLFASHNFMHDYSYYLGFTEANYNLQMQNLGRGGVEGDPEIGNAQAGALTGGQPSFLGRDNANQITLQDGIPGVTNQYLFQPFAGSFYAPCADGSLDVGIVGHEYTHAISNRMVGGPDEGLTSEQGGAMGESWSDLTAAEYQFSHGFSNGGNIWAVGVYATQNKDRAIRDYSIDKNPLNYSDYGFDSTGPEVHADGEIWNGTQWSVRDALVKKYAKQFPYDDDALQRKCSVATADLQPVARVELPGQPALDPAGLRRLPAPAGRHVDARRARRDAGGRPDAVRRRRREGDVEGVRQARHGRRRVGQERRRHRPGAELRHPQGCRQEREGHLQGQGQRSGLRRRLRGPGHPGRRPREVHEARQDGEDDPGQVPHALRLPHPRLHPVHGQGAPGEEAQGQEGQARQEADWSGSRPGRTSPPRPRARRSSARPPVRETRRS